MLGLEKACEKGPEAVALAFVEAINRRDIDALVSLMSDDHVFIDALGTRVRGKKQSRLAWVTYFDWMPDYEIQVENWLVNGNVVGLFGNARGTFSVNGVLHPENRWLLPAAWKAVIGEDAVGQWRAYCDNKPVYEIIERNAARTSASSPRGTPGTSGTSGSGGPIVPLLPNH